MNKTLLACTILVATALCGTAFAQDKKTVAYIAPSLDISYWQWAAYGIKEKAADLGMDYVDFTSENSPAKQMDSARTAVTKGVDAIVIGPVSSTSTPPLLDYLASENVPIAFQPHDPLRLAHRHASRASDAAGAHQLHLRRHREQSRDGQGTRQVHLRSGERAWR